MVLAGNHIYKMDYMRMLLDHVESGADCTVGCIEVPRMDAVAFGVMHVDETASSSTFSKNSPIRPRCPASRISRWQAWAPMCSAPSICTRYWKRTSCPPTPITTFGKDIIPRIVTMDKAIAHPFSMSCVTSSSDQEAPAYWRDVGTVDAYWSANLDLASTIPELDLYDRKWLIWTSQEQLPPGKFVRDLNGSKARSPICWCAAAA